MPIRMFTSSVDNGEREKNATDPQHHMLGFLVIHKAHFHQHVVPHPEHMLPGFGWAFGRFLDGRFERSGRDIQLVTADQNRLRQIEGRIFGEVGI